MDQYTTDVQKSYWILHLSVATVTAKSINAIYHINYPYITFHKPTLFSPK